MAYRYTSLPIFSGLSVISFFEPKNGYSEKKNNLIKYQMRQMLRRTLNMFDWKGLPNTITQRDMEIMIQCNGYVGIIKFNDKYYSVWGGLGGKPNWNYMPSQLVVANPYLGLSKTYNIYNMDDKIKDVVIIPNDSLYEGIIPMLSFHSELLTEIQLTKRATVVVHRMPTAPTAPDNNTYESIKDFYKTLEEGDLASIMTKNVFNDIGSVPLNENTQNIITQVLEMEQYQKAALFNDLGLQLNYNMKRESITSSEAQLGEGALLPFCDDMLKNRKKACEELKDLYGLEVSVEFSSAWKNLRNTMIAEERKDTVEVDKLEAETESIETETENFEYSVQTPELEDVEENDNEVNNETEEAT